MLAAALARAADLCREWTDLDLGNANAWRCLGQANSRSQLPRCARRLSTREAVRSNDRSLDNAVDALQRGIITEFLARYRR